MRWPGAPLLSLTPYHVRVNAATDPHAVRSLDALETMYPQPSRGVQLKVMDHLDAGLAATLALSPLCVLATGNAEGQLDCSPRGDAGSCVTLLDPHTLLLADRPGNNRLDSLKNIVQNPEVGLIFLLPGVDEVIRVNGQAHVTTDPELLARLALKGKLPRVVVVVKVREAFMHCPRAFKSAGLWDAGRHLTPEQRPDFTAMLVEHVRVNSGG